MGRTVIVGDIHGCFDELVELLDAVRLTADDLLVAAGDVVDRGPQPGAVVRFLRERPNTVTVMGNHERKHVRGIFSYAQEITRLQLGDGYAEAVEWMRALPYYFENDDVRVVHAAMLAGVPLAGQKEALLCGSTSGEKELAALFPDDYWYDHYTDAKPVAVGHHVVGREPMVLDDRVFGLDTGACHGGTLTALSVPDFTTHSVDAHADYWAIAMREWQLPVLKTRNWLDLTWAELARATARRSDPWLTEVNDWAAALRALVPRLLASAYHLAGALTPDEIRRQPAASLVFQALHDRLDEATLARQCSTPRRTIELAVALAIPAPSFPG